MARASILWLLGEYSERVPKVAPDVLRKMAKTFGSEVRHMMHFVRIAQEMQAQGFQSLNRSSPHLQSSLNTCLCRTPGKEAFLW